MWGFGGRFYWGRKERCERTEGIVVAFAWMSSEEKHLRSYVRLYGELGWDSLVCHSQFLNMFFPDKAIALAADIVLELVEELRVRPCPVVFASFSGGPKACMYKLLQIIDDDTNSFLKMDDRQLVRNCIAGFIYDSSPVDFTSDLGTKFALHPSVIKISEPPKIVTWIAHSIASSLDALFLSRFESHRAEYWQTLYATVSMKVPYLVLCSETDDLASYQTICNFAQRLQDLGGDVKLLSWAESPHVGHYRLHPDDYKNAAAELLAKATMVYSQRIQKIEAEKMSSGRSHGKISESLSNLRRAAMDSATSFQNITLGSSNQLHLPTSMEYYIGRDGASVHDGHKEGLIRLPSTPSIISAHGILGQILFDVCIPKDIQGWDMRPTSSSSGRPFTSVRRHSAFNPIKCILRSKL